MSTIECVYADALTYQPGRRVPLVIADPPYGDIVSDAWDRTSGDEAHAKWLIDWTNHTSTFQETGDVLYVWGGVGKRLNRPFFRYLLAVESETDYHIKNLITWSKRRAYGVQDNYLFTREECLYLIKGTDKPNVFHIPLLDKERGYAGYDPRYPAKSKFLRRTNVWSDITELFRGKIHPAEKPPKLAEVMIATHTNPGELVLDPFGGSGSTGIAARNLGRDAILVERDTAIFEKMRARIDGAGSVGSF